MTRDVFISYSSKDAVTANAVCTTLEQDGLSCWIAPRDASPGDYYAESLIEGIMASRTLVLLLSSHSNRSPQVLREVERAVSKDIPMVPFRIEEVELSESMEFYISSQHWLDATSVP
jgi:hypothetical protein